jgi:tRNA(Ile)-lysidine synthase
MACGRPQAIATGPKAGASMTSTRTLAIQEEVADISEQHSRASYRVPAPSCRGYQFTGGWQLLYHFSVQELTAQLLKTIRKHESIRPGDRVAVAVSGGADSVALLCLLLELRAELGIVLSVAHVNHKLRGRESDEDERFVAGLAKRHALEIHVTEAPIESSHRSDSTNTSGIEAKGRELRYRFFRQLARDDHVTKIATAHTLDDQAETVLLRIFRGTGVRGLSGIHPRIVFEEHGRAFGEVIRPLLGFRRVALQRFLRDKGQSWLEDSSNRDIAFLRNRVRHHLLPIIAEEFGPAAIEHMADLAEIARAEEDHWVLGHPEIRSPNQHSGEPRPVASLPIEPLLALTLATQRRFVRGWLEMNARDLSISFRLIEETLELTRGLRGKRLELPGGANLLRQNLQRGHSSILLMSQASGNHHAEADYEYPLAIPGSIDVPELGTCFEAKVADVERVPYDGRGQLLNAAIMPKQVLIRNWRAGDRYWPAHTASAKKVKDLLSDRHATGAEKKMWPVAVAEGCGLIWMRGFAVPAAFRAPAAASKAICIQELRHDVTCDG